METQEFYQYEAAQFDRSFNFLASLINGNFTTGDGYLRKNDF